jgi:predicted transcriptional regulator
MGVIMKKEQELVLKITKEIVVKFIEVGRLSVNSFEEVWNSVHQSVRNSLGEHHSVEDIDQE